MPGLPYWLVLVIAPVLVTGEFADEMQVYEKNCLGEDVYHCFDGGCIALSQYCDGKPDCMDASDENLCPDATPEPLKCNETHDFMCIDGKKCIPMHWVCNGERECDDGSDEKGCDVTIVAPAANSTCKGFRCGDNKCISNLWVCDGIYDCADRSDENSETECRSKDTKRRHDLAAIGANCDLVHGYNCGDLSYCIPQSMVCNGLQDCRDSSDEGPFCANWTTMCNNMNCSTKCKPSHLGPVCECESMLKYVNGSCVDIDECVEEIIQCSQHCQNVHRGFRCTCDPGYTTDFAEYLCFAEGGEGLIFYTLRNEIRYYKLKSREDVILAAHTKQAHGVTSDGTFVYWVETAQGHQAVMRAKLDDPSDTKEVLLSLGLEDPGDIAIDWLGGHLYLSDAVLGHIAVCRTDGTACTTLFKGMRHPRFVALHPQMGKIYWADWIDGPVIMRANMDGSEVVKFVENHKSMPSGLTLDIPNQRLYWVDGLIHSIMFDGRNRQSVLKGDIHHPYSVAVFENNVYWSDWASNTLQSCEKLEGQNRKLLLTLKSPVFGIHVYHPVLMRPQNHSCMKHECSHFCLLRGPDSHSCACPQHMTLQSDRKTCIDDSRPQYLFVGGGHAVTRLRYDTLGRPESHAAPIGLGRVDALAYDRNGAWLYTYDGVRKSIDSFDVKNLGSGLRILVSRGLVQVVDMDYDYVSDALYWVDAGRKAIEMYSTKTNARAILHVFVDGEVPISICIVPDHGKMFVAIMEMEQGGVIHIDSFSLDGTDRRHVLQAGLKGPHIKMRYSREFGGVYISDEGNGVIDFIKSDGTAHTNFRELSTSITSLAVTERLVFWTDRRTPRLFYTGLFDALPRVRRLELGMFPNHTQLHLVAISPPLDKGLTIMQHPCAKDPPPCSHVCAQKAHAPFAQNKQTFSCLCPPGLMLDDNNKCVRIRECTANTFYCHSSNTCYDITKRCDGFKDCKRGEDEDGCDKYPATASTIISCGFGKKLCDNICIDVNAVCKETSNVVGVCSDDKFKCSNSTELCIDRSEVCDGRADCPDSSDEMPSLCHSMNCLETEFMCTKGSCVIKSWVCDGEPDCPDGSDEVNCESKTCNAWQYQCNNGECVDITKRCDGQQDCIDFSDEDFCHEHSVFENMDVGARCEDNEYTCPSNSSICLPLTARCNGIPDCPGGVDETECESVHCGRGRFKCTDQIWCVAESKVCDGKKDCDDGSDETPYACKNKNISSTAFPPPIAGGPCQGYRCLSGRCIDWSDVCDGATHCENGEDEEGLCAKACHNHTCEDRCQPSPQGAVCLCAPGYMSEANGKPPCRDINECQIRESCSHICHNTPGSFMCSCHHGHALRSDRRSCKVISGHMSFLYLMGNSVRSMSADGRGASIVYADKSVAAFTDMAYHVRDHTFYLTSEMNGTLYEVNRTRKDIVVTNVGKPSKVALDWVTGNVYFVDNTNGARRMRVCNIPRRRCAVLHRLPSKVEVAALVLDVANKKMFYCLNSEQEAVVWSASLQGHQAADLITLRKCTGLAVDSYKQRLYIADMSHIVQLDYGGEHRETILYDDPHLDVPKGLVLFEDHLYFLTNESYKLNRCILFGDRICEPYINRLLNSNSLTINHETTQRDDIVNACKDHVCDNVCVMVETGPVCVCPDGSLSDSCAPTDEEKLPLFNGSHSMPRMSNVSVALMATALTILVVVMAGWLLYQYRYIMRQNARVVMPVHFQNVQTQDELSAPSEPVVEFPENPSSSHVEFVNPFQYVKDAFRKSLTRVARPAGTASFPPWQQMSPPDRDSDTESDIDTRDDRQLCEKKE